MKKFLFFHLILVSVIRLSGQRDSTQIDTTAARHLLELWKKDLIDPGVTILKDSMIVNPEVQRLIQDSSYRKQIYPETYTWPHAVDLLNKMELKRAFWSFINLYTSDTMNRKLILESVLTYDQAIDMEKAMIAAYYTYSFADPQVGTIINRKFTVNNPEIMENKFNQMKDIVSYIKYYRYEKSQKRNDTQKTPSNEIR